MEIPIEIARKLPAAEIKILKALALHKSNNPLALSDVTYRAQLKSDEETYSAASWLQKKGLLEIQEKKKRVVALGADGKKFRELGLPETRAYQLAVQRAEGITLRDLEQALGADEARIALAWWNKKGLGKIEPRAGERFLMASGSPSPSRDEEFLKIPALALNEMVDEEIVRNWDPETYARLVSRPGVFIATEKKERLFLLTPIGRQVAESSVEVSDGITELTPEFIKSGAWKGKDIRPYDIQTEAPRSFAAKSHPLSQIIEEIREIFVQLGFQEIEDDFVQSAFWNMDALFIPQDHPAREMQDTFYLQHPAKLPVPKDLFDQISRVHKSGGGTKSRGWGTALDPKESERALLRTHTTVGTIRYLARNPKPPIRVFSIGRVFRKETMDATHLPEFHQIEGIATEEGADFRMLLGILQEFYRRLGFPKLRWRPAFFPYTEPSMEVEVWTGTKWMELGGCGVFRPEVTLPLGVKTPVLAWGLGLERLAMMRLGLQDIRDLYISDIEWLRNQPLL